MGVAALDNEAIVHVPKGGHADGEQEVIHAQDERDSAVTA